MTVRITPNMLIWIDAKTGLEWEVVPLKKSVNWDEAMSYAESLESGWRVPTVDELQMLLNRSKFGPVLRRDCPLPFHSSCYWSSTVYTGSTRYAWYVYFGSSAAYCSNKREKHCVYCVRDIYRG